MPGFMRAVKLSVLFAAFGLFGFACGGPQEPAEEGANCYRDRDCRVGLVCVPNGANKQRTCSSDVSGLVSQVETPPPPEDAGMMEDAAPVDDGSAPMDDGSTPMDDGGV